MGVLQIQTSKDLLRIKNVKKTEWKKTLKNFLSVEKNTFNRKLRIKAMLNERSTEFHYAITNSKVLYTFFSLFFQFSSRRYEASSGIFRYYIDKNYIESTAF